ncbi:MAG: PIN domain-containing protein [Chloroflexi bacterium]|nr:PIN domain-containing protein [Chloroflexota bacterium]
MRWYNIEGVLVEVVQVLSSRRRYYLPRADIRDYLTGILSFRGMDLPYKCTYLRALEIYAQRNIDFVDALAVAHMERPYTGAIVSFDRDVDRIPGITRREP